MKLSPALKRDEIGLNRHRALALCLSMIFSENRCTLFRIMLWLVNTYGVNAAGAMHEWTRRESLTHVRLKP